MRSNEISGYRVCHQTRTSQLLTSPLFTALGGRFDDNVLAFYFSDFYDPERISPFPLSLSLLLTHSLTPLARSLALSLSFSISLSFSFTDTLPLCLTLSLSPVRSSSGDFCVPRRRCKQSDIFFGEKIAFPASIRRLDRLSITVIVTTALVRTRM